MPDENTAVPGAENKAEETVDTTKTETDEGGKGQQPSEDVDKQERSEYAKQLEELQKREQELKDKLQKKDEIIEHKNRAIETMKKKSDAAPVQNEDELADKLLKKLEEKQAEKTIEARVKALTSDATEQEVILRHFRQSINRTGDVETDLMNAVALTDREKVWQQRQNRALEERREDFLSTFAGSSLRGDISSSPALNDPILKQAADIVRAVNPKAVEHLGKRYQ